MQINSFINNISFKKRLVANCAVLNNNGQSEQCAIYQISPYEDADYFTKVQKDENWNGSEYLPFIANELPFLKRRNNVFEIYSMEDKNGNCIAFTELHPEKSSIYVDNLETAPKYVNDKKQSALKYIGETFVTFATKLAQGKQKPIVKLNPADTSIDFYTKNCHMDYDDDHVLCTLPQERYNLLINQNQHHTGSELDLVS